MKTIQQIQAEINQTILHHRDSEDATMREVNKAQARLSLLRRCIIFLEGSPSLEFLKRQRDECEFKINTYNRRLKEYIQSTPAAIDEKTKKRTYYSEIAPNEKSELKNATFQLETIQYLMSND